MTSCLFTHVLTGSDKKITNISAQEKLKALEILQGIFLLHPISKEVVVENNGIKVFCQRIALEFTKKKVLFDFLDIPQFQLPTLETLLTWLVDSETTQKVFVHNKGVDKIMSVALTHKTTKEVRLE